MLTQSTQSVRDKKIKSEKSRSIKKIIDFIVNSDKPRKNKENGPFFVFVLSANQGQKMKTE